MTDDERAERLRKLQAARTAGVIPTDLLPRWFLDSLIRGEAGGMSPLERLSTGLSDEISRWIARRRVTHRTISVNRRTLARALKGEGVTIASVSAIADALDCDVTIRFHQRGPKLAPQGTEIAPTLAAGEPSADDAN